MLTLNDLASAPDFGLTLVTGDGGSEVEQALVPRDPDAELAGALIERALVVADPGRIGHPDRLVRTLAAAGAAGLALAGTRAGDPRTAGLVAAAAAAGVPLLVGPHPTVAWRELAAQVAALGAGAVRQRNARLAGLLDRLPVPGADERVTVRQLTAYLARELDAEVLVHADGEALAAAPAAAAASLAPLLDAPVGIRQRTAGGGYARSVMLSAAGDATLVVATKEPDPDPVLVAYTAKALRVALAGLRERRTTWAVGDALRGVRLSAFQLFMTGHTVAAQRVVAGIEGSLLDSDSVRVFILDCNRASRETVLGEAERVLADVALTVRCPAYQRHLIFLAPRCSTARAEEGLHGLMHSFDDARTLLGGSLVHPLDAVPDAYGEALDCVTRAGRNPDRVAMASRVTGIVDVLAPDVARAWATRLLRPVLAMPRGGTQILETTAMAVEFEMSATARVIGVHRNTVTRRVRQVFDAVGLDQDGILDRVVLSLAAQIVARYGNEPPVGRDDADHGAVPDLHTLLSEPALRAWAERVLRPLADDRRDLLRTVREWVRHGCRFEPAALSLGIAAKTVRSRIHAAELLLERDLTGETLPAPPDESEHRLASIRPLAVALYATARDGARPPLPGGRD
ncbi:PucR C-terminal helix-turn-helix domain-containing protein [Actinacidiphila yanglinensis]|uniref:PucR C-terminal helix-turn-helix domain-containing protein n=1 Tax=Actinacidiphila yanglinensis TaxID=310779 RepID=A0A1H5ZWR6_9ACTN|nr:helix-turn-helix domain-containing protein [Actinacidiphila yanglinensis]SEG40953.1 PucR C-terminal helix-turn-helix domain-containing protein [Actinacidiphila yanglinensis]